MVKPVAQNQIKQPAAGDLAVLPRGTTEPVALEFPHFPTRWQAVLWRNWGLVPPERLAIVLQTSHQQILASAQELGLTCPPRVNPRWLTHGYITIIRNNWHLLPYEQLLELLDWSAEQLAYTLKEDDFLWVKLGFIKPKCQQVHYEPLTPAQQEQTRWIRSIAGRYLDSAAPHEEAFAFVDRFEQPVQEQSAQLDTQSKSRFDLAFGYSYCAPCGDPLMSSTDRFYPEAMLRDFSRQGINGIWLHGILYTLFPWDYAPELCKGYETRLANLRRLTEIAHRHGIGVYLYLNEPRGLPLPFFERHPEFAGAESVGRFERALCTSYPQVLDFVSNACEYLFNQVPLLAGVFCITMSENTTHCKSKPMFVKQPCPRCESQSPPQLIAGVISAIEQGVHKAKPDARVMAWNWAWDPAWEHEALDLLPANVDLLCASEEYLHFTCGGVESHVRDYSISRVGPSERSLKMWQHAQQRGLGAVAKVQLNCTWECSAVPYLPTPLLVEKHLDNLYKNNIKSLMVSWTLGGYPGGNLELLRKSCREIATDKFGARAAEDVLHVWEELGEALKEFPFHLGVLYYAPQNFGPMNQLYAKPTGYKATMIGFCYDDLTSWRRDYPEDVLASQFCKLSEKWKQGLEKLSQLGALLPQEKQAAFQELQTIAEAAYCHFRSTYLQIEFVRQRQCSADSASPAVNAILDEEVELAHRLYRLVRQDSRIGFEASNHYYYTQNDLLEKILNCESLRSGFATK